MTAVKARAYWQLMRMDRPIGSLLLLWPTLWALLLAAQGLPDLRVLVVFVLGVFLMRSAGCVINDYADRHVDGHVKRTSQRPLPAGLVSAKEALTVICSSCCQLVLTRVDYEYPNYPALFYRYSVSLCLPVYEALHSPASTGAWPRVQLVDSYGLGCSSKYADSTSLGTVFD